MLLPCSILNSQVGFGIKTPATFNQYGSGHSMSIDDVDNRNDSVRQDLISNQSKANGYVMGAIH